MIILAIFFTSFVLTLLTVPPTIILAKKFGLVDDPSLRPHPAHQHQRIIPRAGGLPIFIAILATSLIFLPMEKHLLGIFGGAAVLLAVGLLDDRLVRLSPYLRLLLLFLAAGVAVASGIGISFITNPLGILPLPDQFKSSIMNLDQVVLSFNLFGPHQLILIADIFALFWIVTLTQVINWSKGVDGQMPGITMIAASTLGLLSWKLFLAGDPHQLSVAKLAFLVAGASLGFLIFNWHPAKILPGFSGSTILAFMLATLSILSGAKVATALFVLAVPTADFVYTFLRRILSGRSPVWGDRGHLHHHLLNLGWSHQKISLFYILGSGMFGAVALILDSASKIYAGVLIAIVSLGIILWLNSFGELSKQPGPGNG